MIDDVTLSKAKGLTHGGRDASAQSCSLRPDILWRDITQYQGANMIFHITSRVAWAEAQKRGDYHEESLTTEGFIHCSTLVQVLPVANNFYKGQSGLILLEIEPTLLSSTLKWEPPSGGTPPPGVAIGDMFPHIYGSINLDAVIKIVDLVSKPDGTFDLPTA